MPNKLLDPILDEDEIIDDIEEGEDFQLLIEKIEDSVNELIDPDFNEKKGGDNTRYDLISAYLREIGKYKLLTKEEELALGIKIKNGDSFASKQLFQANLRFVVYIAKRGIFQNRGLSLLDLIQAGNIGLLKASQKFDIDLGKNFTNYAKHKISAEINEAISKGGKDIYIPPGFEKLLYDFRTINRKNILEKGIEPTDEQLAYMLNINPEKLKELKEFNLNTISLETPIGDNEETLEIFVEDQTKNVEENIFNKELKNEINELLDTLNPREIKILSLRFGFNGEYPHTLEETAKIFNIGTGRVGQLEKEALLKLKKSPKSAKKIKKLFELLI
ncbi:RNA polymerase sigma factor RpoD/SigA [Candidatus Gracilibacteria bacterium]|nr:RNA polymerase sigma factor RpoD/SigA [Candidatus Gracilibacteria bacterium]